MQFFNSASSPAIITAVYVGAVVCLNYLLLLISDFYRKKFDQPAPRLGFYVSIAAGLLFLGMLAAGQHASYRIQVIQSILLIVGALGGMLGAIKLFVTMTQIKK